MKERIFSADESDALYCKDCRRAVLSPKIKIEQRGKKGLTKDVSVSYCNMCSNEVGVKLAT